MNKRWRNMLHPYIIYLFVACTIGIGSIAVHALCNSVQEPEVHAAAYPAITATPVQLAFAETVMQTDANAKADKLLESIQLGRLFNLVSRGGDFRSQTQSRKDEPKPTEEPKPEVKVTIPVAPAHGPLIYDNFRMTAYDLSVEACGKSRRHPEYGECASGFKLNGMNITDRKIAVDPRYIKMWSKVYIEFEGEARYITLKDGTKFDLNGVYQAVDTGGAIKRYSIDLFFGEDAPDELFYHKLCDYFGVQHAKVYSME